jgi:hypothetical protein
MFVGTCNLYIALKDFNFRYILFKDDSIGRGLLFIDEIFVLIIIKIDILTFS